MIAPKLNKGDAIGVFSPSSPATATARVRYGRGKAYLESKGYRIVEGDLTGRKDFYRSGSIAQRVDELNALIRNPDVRCIMSSIGGMNSNSLLPYIDYEALAKDPKIVIGYSDVTAILFAIYARTGLVTYYGPALVASFGELPPFVDETFGYFESIVSDKASFPHVLPTPDAWTDEFLDWETQDRAKRPVANALVTVCGGKAEGRLVAGNLNTMEGFWGTRYFPAILEGDILMIEDSMKDASTIERSFAMLKLNGVFERIGGLVLGKHEKFDDRGSGRMPYDILVEVMGDVRFPVLAQFDCCHTHPMLTLPIGSRVGLDADAQRLTILREDDEGI